MDIMELTNNSLKIISNLQTATQKQNDYHKDFIKILITLSAGIVGFTVPIFDQSGIIKCDYLFKVALGGFLVTILLGLCDLCFAIIQERENIKELNNDLMKTVRIETQAIQDHLGGKDSVTVKQDMVSSLVTNATENLSHINSKIKECSGNMFYLTICIFVLSLILLFISII